MKKFDNELAEVTKRLLEMGQLTIEMVDLAVSAVKDRAHNMRDRVALLETRLDNMQTDIDRTAIRMLTVYGPVAHDLRYVLVVNHITAQMERIGDQVVNVCDSLELMRSPPEHGTLPMLPKMAELTREMVRDSLDSYFSNDTEKAEVTRTHDDLVDALNHQVSQKLLSDEVLRGMLTGTADIADAVAQILIARHWERIADQAVNICKEVIYMVHGDDVRHRPSGRSLEQPGS